MAATRMEFLALVCLNQLLIDFSDNVGGSRTLTEATYTNTTGMTDESCIAFCTTGGFIFAGAEYAQECCEFFFPVTCHYPFTYLTTLSCYTLISEFQLTP
jgi:hypothetical protein